MTGAELLGTVNGVDVLIGAACFVVGWLLSRWQAAVRQAERDEQDLADLADRLGLS